MKEQILSYELTLPQKIYPHLDRLFEVREPKKVIKVNPAYTSKVCHSCGKERKLDGLSLKCSCGTYDRDYNGNVNIAFCLTKPKAQGAEGIPGSIPSRLVQVEWKALLSFISFTKLLCHT